jgi:MoaA/NifB/PqqE/SkfB family radical SAM enzyme
LVSGGGEKNMTISKKTEFFKKKYPQLFLNQKKSLYPNREINLQGLGRDPGLFTVRLGFSCKAKCIHCFVEGNRIQKDLSLGEIKATIDTVKKGSIIIISGGEPTDREELLDVLKYLKENGYIVHLESNGIKLSNKDYLETLRPYIDIGYIPVHSSDPAIHDATTRVPGSFKDTLQGLKNLYDTEILQMTITVINQMNYKTLLNTFDLIQENFPGQLMSLTFPHPTGAAHSKNVVPRYYEVKPYIQEVLKKWGRVMFVHYIPKCFTFPYQNIVADMAEGVENRHGQEYINGEWKVVNYNKPDSGFKVKPESCKYCIFYSQCPGVWKEYSELYPDLEKDLIPITHKEVIKELSLKNPALENQLTKIASKNSRLDLAAFLEVEIPKYVVRMGYTCSNKCIHCFVADKRDVKDLTTDEVKDQISQVKAQVITFTGGEPSERDDLLELLKYSKRRNSLNDVQTNGIKFSDSKYLDELEQYIDYALMPIHSKDYEISDAITKRPGSAEKIWEGFKNLSNSTIIMATQTVINKFNYQSILDTFNLIQEINPGVLMNLTFPHPRGAANSIDVVPRLSDVREVIQEVLKKHKNHIATHYIPKCYLYPYQNEVHITDDEDGTEKPGIEYIENSWKKTDYGEINATSRIKCHNCKECIFNDECLGVSIEYAKLYTDFFKDLKPITPFLVSKKKLEFSNIPQNKIDAILSRNPGFTGHDTSYILRTGYSCNNRCIHCFVEDRKAIDNLSTEEVKTEIDVIKEPIVIVTGGEPTMRKDLQEILLYCKQKHLFVELQTNGVKLSNKDYLKTVAPFFDSLFLPIHSSDNKIFDSITQVEKSFEQTIQAMKNAMEYEHIFIVTETVINKLNYKTLLSTLDMIQSINPGCTMAIACPHPVGAAFSRNVTPMFSEITDYLQPALKKYAYLMHTHYIPRCYLYPYHEIVQNMEKRDNGTVYKPGIDYLDGKWKRFDYGKFHEGSRVKCDKCKNCIFDKECYGVWKEYGELYDLDLHPILHI